MTIHFGYEKKQVLQALRYHFLTRPEIKFLLVVVNIFTVVTAILVYLHKVQPLSFLIFSVLWFLLLITVWRLLPATIYRKSETFVDHFSMDFEKEGVVLQTQRGDQHWYWKNFSSWLESPYFFHLYFNSRSFFLVPKDAFPDITSLQAARELIRSNIKK